MDSNRPVVLVSAAVARPKDQDMGPIIEACTALGLAVRVVDWHDAGYDWSTAALAVLRSPWDYSLHLDAFLDWADRVAGLTTLLNPAPLVRWNADKRYLVDLAARGVPTVPTAIVCDPATLAAPPDAAEFVVKPSVGAGSRGCLRVGASQIDQARAHAADLLADGATPLVQPYFPSVDARGETALVFFGGAFSHAIRKGALLAVGAEPKRALFAAEHISVRDPAPAELAIARACLEAVPGGTSLAYARVDLITDPSGAPHVLELEIIEPSLFVNHATGAAGRFAAVLRERSVRAG